MGPLTGGPGVACRFSGAAMSHVSVARMMLHVLRSSQLGI